MCGREVGVGGCRGCVVVGLTYCEYTLVTFHCGHSRLPMILK